jgi:hypothetical protein
MAGSIEEVKKAKKLFMFIGLLLFFFTIVTVMVDWHRDRDFQGFSCDADLHAP